MMERIVARLMRVHEDNPVLMVWAMMASVALSIVVIVLDVFLPLDWWVSNYIRAFAAIVLAVPMFISGYLLALRQHDGRVARADENGTDYVAFRLRYSYRSRVQQSLIAGSVLALLAIITSYTHIYTLSAAIILAAAYGIVLYCRLTPDEKTLKKYGVPDPRDVMDERDRIVEELEKEARAEVKDEMKREIRKEKNKKGKNDGKDDKDTSTMSVIKDPLGLNFDSDDDDDDWDEDDDDNGKEQSTRDVLKI